MARPRQGIDAYLDIRPIWSAAVVNQHVARTFPTEREAIACVQRLHALRQRWRETQSIEIAQAEQYLVSRNGCRVTIEKREHHDVTEWETGAGAPIDPKPVIEHMIEMDRAALGWTQPQTHGPQNDPNPFDPDKPLDL